MVGERDRILTLINYVESLGLEVNYGKNKARGNKGFFRVKSEKYRIDISKDLDSTETLRVLVHEFSHYIHYMNDKTLKSLDFLDKEIDDVLMEELISLTVDSIPKETIKPLFDMQTALKKTIVELQGHKFDIFKLSELRIKKRMLNSVNNKISRINRYYNSATELFARSMEEFILNNETFQSKAPNLFNVYTNYVNKNSLLLNFIKNVKI